MDIVFMCALCGGDIKKNEALGVNIFPANSVTQWQQYWAHPLCVKGMLVDTALVETREEISSLWDEK